MDEINIPYHEEMARRINWCQYDNCRMLSYTPYYIILGEFGVAILLAILAKRVSRGNWTAALWAMSPAARESSPAASSPTPSPTV